MRNSAIAIDISTCYLVSHCETGGGGGGSNAWLNGAPYGWGVVAAEVEEASRTAALHNTLATQPRERGTLRHNKCSLCVPNQNMDAKKLETVQRNTRQHNKTQHHGSRRPLGRARARIKRTEIHMNNRVE